MPQDTLTARQAEILELIRAYVSEEGCPPTRAEIADPLGFRSPNAAEDHLRALERKGYIELVPGASRGTRLLETAARVKKLPDGAMGAAQADGLAARLTRLGMHDPPVLYAVGRKECC